jgi:hypothetical protein
MSLRPAWDTEGDPISKKKKKGKKRTQTIIKAHFIYSYVSFKNNSDKALTKRSVSYTVIMSIN